MPALVYDPLLREIKSLHLLAFTLKEHFDKQEDAAVLRAAWQPFRLKQEEIEKKLPWVVKEKGDFQRHCQWLERRLQQGRPEECYSDLAALCFNDIPEIEQRYLAYLLGTGPASARHYNWPDIHSLIRAESQSRFEAKHYADAVEAAFKEINHMVKQAYRQACGEDKERDGDDLMRKAFSYQRNSNTHAVDRPPRLLLTDRDLATDSGFNVQDGYMNLFAGAMRGIRNPKAHGNVTIDATEAWEMLVFASHLLRMWDRGQATAKQAVADQNNR